MKEGINEAKYVQVIIDKVSDALDRPFQYQVPLHLHSQVHLGAQVLVPFRSGKMNAFVVQLDDEPLVEEPRPLLAVLENQPGLREEMVQLSYWVAKRFFTRWSESIGLCLPPARKRVKKKYNELVYPLVDGQALLEEAERIKSKAFRQALVLQYLAISSQEGMTWPELREKTGASRQSLNALMEKGWIKARPIIWERDPWSGELPSNGNCANLTLTGEQENAWAEIKQSLENPEKDILLFGITGSGKTELYFKAVQKVVQEGRQALVLVPEIALTPHMVEQLRRRFPGQVGMLHSGLPDGERYDQWWKIREGKVKIVLGSRSAVFAPFKNLGLIVMDEEHENTYRQDDSPRYHARDVARWRARFHHALLLMGSATPSLEMFLESRKGKVKMLELKERVAGRTLPAVDVVDMREETRYRKRSVFSTKLYGQIKQALGQGEQVILFLNRRGFAGFALCRRCGHVVECPYCSVSLTYHYHPEHLQCHYCNYKREPLESCPNCHSFSIGNFGLGTQRLEQQVKEAFPGAEVIRMDSDAATGKGVHEKMWRAFKEKKASILIGTQMVAKGHDFPEVTLVGVIAADINLHLPDFRAGEKTFQLLTQVSGRAGRGDKQGKVLVQTFSPDHYSIVAASFQDYMQFIQEESQRRSLLNYPPFADLIIFGCSATEEKDAAQVAENLKVRLEPALEQGDELLGPAPAPVKRVKGYYRYQLVYKGLDLQEKNDFFRETVWSFRKGLIGDIRVTVDFNPLLVL